MRTKQDVPRPLREPLARRRHRPADEALAAVRVAVAPTRATEHAPAVIPGVAQRHLARLHH
eukprot:5480541-Pyramimonas_sp.AAC.1